MAHGTHVDATWHARPRGRATRTHARRWHRHVARSGSDGRTKWGAWPRRAIVGRHVEASRLSDEDRTCAFHGIVGSWPTIIARSWPSIGLH